ncbi:TRAP transporter small permease [Thalassospira alkalitolerans]|uniref:TRAP transporter small permease protein n=1 Tax=Thalassospira alkalitolerans TaxID=1293890 RepID=A0A1Y2LGF1_9PROT|nr:TRAP transporter small permease [Thalassospira alkalitolerans]OSQ50370.1 C4-dicarboxylate ABC transporter permease [Thalassospira alkalitolerans]
MQRAENAFRRLLAGLSGFSILVVFGVVFAGSVSRYLFSAPLQWSEEVAKYAMIYGTMFGMAFAYLQGTQITFSIFIDAFPAAIRRKFGVGVDLATFVLGGILVYAGLIFAAKRGGIVASGIGIPMYWAQIAMTIGGGCLLIAALFRLIALRPKKSTGGEA